MIKKRWLTLFLTMAFVMIAFSGVSSAATPNNASNIGELIGTGAVGNTTTGDANIQGDIADIVGKVRMIGGAVAFVMLLIAGIQFSTSGKNEQKRAGAFASLIGVAVGIYIIFQAGGIATWFSGLGQ